MPDLLLFGFLAFRHLSCVKSKCPGWGYFKNNDFKAMHEHNHENNPNLKTVDNFFATVETLSCVPGIKPRDVHRAAKLM